MPTASEIIAAMPPELEALRQGPRTINEDDRWEPGARCDETIMHLGQLFGCCYGKGHDDGRDHGASVEDASGHTTHDISWNTGDTRPRVHPADYWSTQVEHRVRADGCRVAEVRYV